MPGLGSGSKGVRNLTAHSWILIGSVNWRTAAAKTPDSEAMVASSCGGTGGCSGLDARSSGPEQTLAPASGATGILGPDGHLFFAVITASSFPPRLRGGQGGALSLRPLRVFHADESATPPCPPRRRGGRLPAPARGCSYALSRGSTSFANSVRLSAVSSCDIVPAWPIMKQVAHAAAVVGELDDLVVDLIGRAAEHDRRRRSGPARSRRACR